MKNNSKRFQIQSRYRGAGFKNLIVLENRPESRGPVRPDRCVTFDVYQAGVM